MKDSVQNIHWKKLGMFTEIRYSFFHDWKEVSSNLQFHLQTMLAHYGGSWNTYVTKLEVGSANFYLKIKRKVSMFLLTLKMPNFQVRMKYWKNYSIVSYVKNGLNGLEIGIKN
jgi:hypothetical protein